MKSISERLLHRWRRRRAKARLASAPPPRSIVFVCKGNLYRSPFGAAFMIAAIAGRTTLPVRITSAGFVRPGRIPPPAVLHCARRYGVELEGHTSRLIAALNIPDWDLFVVMDPSYGDALRRRYRLEPSRILVLGDLDPQSIRQRRIEDPDGASPEALESTYARIARCTEHLATLLATR